MQKRLLARLAAVLLAFVPALVAMGLVAHYFQADLTAFCPAYDVDQYMYVVEARTFAAAGFSGGYYGSGGQTAKLLRFGPHGAVHALVYGGLAKLLGGWRDWLVPVLNLAFVTLALLGLGRKLSLGRFACLTAFFCLFPQTLLYLPLSYQEAFQYAVALLLALGLSGYLLKAAAGAASGRDMAWALGLVFLAGLSRPTWAVLFPALLWARAKPGWRGLAWSLAGGGGLLAATYGAFSLFASPWHVASGPGMLQALARLDFGPLLHQAGGNLASLLNFQDNAVNTLNLLIIAGGTGLLAAVSCLGKPRRFGLAAFHVCNVFGPLALYVVAYNGTGYQLTRLLSAHFLLSFAMFLLGAPAGAARWAAGPILAACLGMLPMSLKSFVIFVRPAYDDYAGYARRIDALRRDMAPALLLSKDAPSPWLRTLAVVSGDETLPSLAAPDCYGVQVYVPSSLDAPLRAGFVLLDAKAHALAAKANALTHVADTAHGALYRNDVAFGFAGK
ncbi:hypothetical protein [Solidesulfovibrio carbinolicus]|uniref:Glycosyltransferase RgtA/B/C/D-like domain-containing protein n=1 Tax=Solidesulfovibrio carbinolicus TaxID=296842 RepID=A0A4P6HQK2_9BACT|nr:hypothetical protein [Solidesulfovibrio carbinolicus]QAZ69611.1 hypothetical protein C3Y92_20280 [Solidesulfovibrio carbinolicus]